MSNFNKLCRLCLKKCRPNDNYEDLGHDYSIRCKVAIQEIFNIIVSVIDFLCTAFCSYVHFCLFQNGNATFPTKVCIDCSQKVLLFYDYFVVVQKNQEILHNGLSGSLGQNNMQNARSLPSLINLNKRQHYTAIPSANIFEAGTSGAAEMDIDNSIDGFRGSDMNSISNLDTKPDMFSTPKPFLTFEERKAIEEKIKLIKDNMTDDEKIKIFYGLQCTTCNTSVEFNKLVEYEEHCLKEHDIEVTSFMCCKTKIKRQFLVDHIEYHLGTPAVRVLRPRGQTMGPLSIFNSHESHGGCPSMNGSISVEGDNSNKGTENDLYKFPCNRCERSYMVKSSLKRHMTISHGFTCEDCDKTFDDDIKLKKHRFIFHSTDGPFNCNICPSVHDTRRQLYNHKRWHTRQVNATNPNAISLDDDDDHEDLTSEKPAEEQPIIDDQRIFKCIHCPGAFHSNRNLKIHMSLKHKKTLALVGKSIKKRYVSPFNKKLDLPKLRCKICGFLSLYRQNLKRHIRIRHPEHADTEEEVNAMFEDTSMKPQEIIGVDEEEAAIQDDNEMELTDKSDNIQVTQIKEEHEDSLNMYHCLSNSLLP